MTLEEARLLIVEGINYAAYKETDSSLYILTRTASWVPSITILVATSSDRAHGLRVILRKRWQSCYAGRTR
jgi:hypothetical protein